MTSWIRLILLPVLFCGAPGLIAAADRDAGGGRETRMESDELRADIRQHRLKKVKQLDDLPAQQQVPNGQQPNAQQPNAGTGSKPGS
jgi:hypothetical protein